MKFAQLYAAAAILSASPRPFVAATGGNNFTRRCGRLIQTFKQPNVKVLYSGYVTKGTNLTFPDGDPSCGDEAVVLADMCRLQLNITTSPTSNVITEVWLPVDWKDKGRRFAMTGNGGSSGCLMWGDIAYAAALGFATVGHNNGHDGMSGLPFLNRPETVIDFAYRALGVSTTVGKLATNFFYQDTLTTSYYWGCSGAGRQGHIAAQRYPEEYNGIIAADPAAQWNRLAASILSHWYTTGPVGSPTYLTFPQWQAVNDEVLKQCDGIDGVLDGVLEDPMKCQPYFEAMLCTGGQTWESDQCLTVAQVEAVKKTYQPTCGNKGRFAYNGYQPGNDQFVAFNFVIGEPSSIALDYLRYAYYNDASWTLPATQDDFLAVIDELLVKDPFDANADYPDLTRLKNAGHKLLSYHGGSDGFFPYTGTQDLYDATARNMSLSSRELDDFYRFFMIPGLGHCAGGNGAWYIGGPSQYGAGGIGFDPQESLLMKMVKWAEEGVPIDTIKGYSVDATTGALEGAVREHCRHPMHNYFKGGDPKLPSSWECRFSSLYP
ncbi:Tannase [Drechslerella dactyloides]|uniref:Carboxylic ester hydrolase n=1 Tax=Drechslerella dactyloides TaxID=74499 RepID=A0AAD6J0L9_DREDA|nr:Tannase [Drechslerella dactyloides]